MRLKAPGKSDPCRGRENPEHGGAGSLQWGDAYGGQDGQGQVVVRGEVAGVGEHGQTKERQHRSTERCLPQLWIEVNRQG